MEVTETEKKEGRSHEYSHKKCEDTGSIEDKPCTCWLGKRLQSLGKS